ncbi:hypothetical protein HAX54_042873 [Datura stramonium]|uniref:Uncharacterized protein n=1 Tax=Datura stramonium TaxID=4076 RepID=A0ABS8W334_DATST|nr:hypothetical protein [Datura stramonium]
MEVEGILYETQPPPPPPQPSTTDHLPPSSSEEHEPYVVFRNEISLSTLQYPSPETAAADYFSLDLEGDICDLNNSSVSTRRDRLLPFLPPEVFGSFKTGLYLPTSDVDVDFFVWAMIDLFTGIMICWLIVVLANLIEVTQSDELLFEIQLVILRSEIRSPQLISSFQSSSQKGVAKKIQVHDLTCDLSSREHFLL